MPASTIIDVVSGLILLCDCGAAVRGRGRPRSEGLTARQVEVVRAYAKSGTMEATVERLGGTSALSTIKAHLDVARRKLGVPHVSQLPYAYFKATGDNPLEDGPGELCGPDCSCAGRNGNG